MNAPIFKGYTADQLEQVLMAIADSAMVLRTFLRDNIDGMPARQIPVALIMAQHIGAMADQMLGPDAHLGTVGCWSTGDDIRPEIHHPRALSTAPMES